MLKVGDKAIDFCLRDCMDSPYNLSQFLGKKVILYFYPKDGSAGCTKQALEFKELYDEFKVHNAIVIGVSKDSYGSHLRFRDKNKLPFLLLSDFSTEVLNAYGVYQEKSMAGKKRLGIVRSIFVIDEKGIVRSAEYKVPSTKSAKATLEIVKKIDQGQ